MAGDHRYLWSTRFVCERLGANTLSEAATFGYFLAIMAFDWLQFTVIAVTPRATLGPWAIASSWLTFGVTIAGLIFLYTRNGGDKGERFLQRYFPLSVTVGWKFVIAAIAATWLSSRALAGESAGVRGWGATLAGAAVNLVMFWRIGVHLRAIAKR